MLFGFVPTKHDVLSSFQYTKGEVEEAMPTGWNSPYKIAKRRQLQGRRNQKVSTAGGFKEKARSENGLSEMAKT
eukprot:6089326-Amphidinium_carterae.1